MPPSLFHFSSVAVFPYTASNKTFRWISINWNLFGYYSIIIPVIPFTIITVILSCQRF